MARATDGMASGTGIHDVGTTTRRAGLKHDMPQTRTSSNSIVERIIEIEILPGLAALHSNVEKPAKPSVTGFDEAKIAELTAASLSDDPSRASGLVADLLEHGATRQAIFGGLLARTARRLGEMWEEDACSFVDVTIGLNRLHQILREHATMNPPTPARATSSGPGRSIFLMPAPGEQHIFGMLVLADHFRSQGWRVDLEFSYTSAANTLALVAGQNYGCLGFTISNHRCTDALTDTVSTLRNTLEWGRRPILVGGSLFDSDRTLVARVGADSGAHNEVDAFAIAKTLIESRTGRETSENR